MTPFKRLCNGLHEIRHDLNAMLDEMLAFAEVMARKQNSLELDDNDFYYVTASGQVDEVLANIKIFVERLERIKKQKDNNIDR